MKRIIVLAASAMLFFGCKELSGENDYQLIGNCADLKSIIEKEIIPINTEKGIHYVSVDTVNCTLKVRYEADKVDLAWLYSRLDSLNYLVKPVLVESDTLQNAVDSISAEVVVDTIIKDQKSVHVVTDSVKKEEPTSL